MNNYRKIYSNLTYLLLTFIFITFISCEDTAPTEYTPSYVVQALLIVNEPIKGISVLESASLRDSFLMESTIIKDASVQITGDDKVFDLMFNPESNSYEYADSTYKVKPHLEYKISIKLNNGKAISGTTFTPNAFEWIKEPPKDIQYPKDTLNLPSNFNVSWTKTDTIKYYILSILALDTLNYGKYLSPQTEELNRRILRPWNKNSKYYFRDLSSWGFAPTSDLPVVWNFFKWFGMQELTVYAPDDNFLKWSLQVFSFRELDPQLSTLKGAFGYFGSAARIRTQSFLIKNQP